MASSSSGCSSYKIFLHTCACKAYLEGGEYVPDFMANKDSITESRTVGQENFPCWLVELAMRNASGGRYEKI